MAAPNLQPKHANFITRSVALSQQINAAYVAWVGLREEWDSQGYSTGIVDQDFTGPNSYLVAADLALFYTSQGNMVTYWGAGNGTNITKLIP
jgi:hypothetical protein